jgi:hypothetical protein
MMFMERRLFLYCEPGWISTGISDFRLVERWPDLRGKRGVVAPEQVRHAIAVIVPYRFWRKPGCTRAKVS